MAETSTIEWTDATWNPITGCTLVDEGCRHCYAATLATTRMKNHPSRAGLARVTANGEAKFTGEVRLNPEWMPQPLRWKRPRRIFVCAHGDLFHPAVPDDWIDQVFAVMAITQRHTYQVLTKRPERAREYLTSDATLGRLVANLALEARKREAILTLHHVADGFAGMVLPNVWLGTSISEQASADARIPALLQTPAAVRFLSAEPLLGPVSLRCIMWPGSDRGFADALTGKTQHAAVRLRYPDRCPDVRGLDWVIVGGESGKRARPMNPQWARDIRDQCVAAGVPFFFKQWGEWVSFSDGRTVRRTGKALAGRMLDGVTWDQMPGDAQ